MASETFCRHFPHLGIMNDTCKAGVEMRTVRDESERPFRLPCCHPEVSYLCAKHEAYTAEEIAESDRYFAEALEKATALWSRQSEDCPHCGVHVATMERVGHCVYAYPCGCRQYQGKVPKKWQMGKESEEES